MKKSIKYAGIAAATLLAVAPVAAPVVSTTAQAAVTSVATDQSKQNDAVTAFGNQFADVAAKSIADGGKSITLGSQKLSDFATNNAGLIKTAATLENMNDLIGSGATVSVSAKYGSTSINNQADLTKILADETYPAVEFTITLNYNNLNDQAVSKTYTVKATRTTTDNNANELKTVNAKFTTPISVALNSTTTSTQLTATTDIHLTDQNGDGVVAGTVKADPNYYNTYADAMNGNTASATDAVSKNKFTKAGTYYQAISFTAGNGSSLATFISNYKQDPSSYTVYVNGAKASAGYDFASSDNTKLTFVRAINVSNTTDQWTTTDTTGVVTTKSASKYYTLKNDDNVTIANRALGANTPWRTDKVRTNQDGVKQYRVATGEWIDADDVTFAKAGSDNGSSTGAYTDVKALNGSVTTKGPAGYYYPLYTDNGEQISNRGVSGLTSWYTDKSAKNADGVTVYHVATGEWLQGTNVTYTAY
ncbi:hypothetical protein NV391_00710 [Companilactobacillus crustorum]|uniref:hypothetical protein n=1 Tax=Companilactobacillus crustorum TaxID=392416 RepID=UPI00237D9344|nr:hypothetical protein [Companilactobacillus crustorum]WDT65793.1 hypothetical protein NV391_00710 [Companilactobacillus crustorum]